MKLIKLGNRYNGSETSPFWQLHRELDRMFSGPFGDLVRNDAGHAVLSPVMDVREDAEKVQVVVELPGIRREDVQLAWNDGVLSLSGVRKAEIESKDGYHRQERYYGRFERHVEVGVPVQGDAIQAQYKDGLLTVTLPKAEGAKPRSIQIQAD
jgi:HSP20 family protein